MRLLDLFCGAGGAAMGYHRAGFEVVGVDIAPQRHYPFEFHQADALEYLAEHGQEFDAIHASPPCQEYSATRHLRDANQIRLGYVSNIRPKLVEDMYRLLRSQAKPWIIENVPGSPMPGAIELCGTMFGIELYRHRWFESNLMLFAAGPCHHTGNFYNVVGGKVRGYGKYSSGKMYQSAQGPRRREGYPGKATGERVMGIDWMTIPEMCESIPPVYTEFIGHQLMDYLERVNAA